jgi:hypothetical protein
METCPTYQQDSQGGEAEGTATCYRLDVDGVRRLKDQAVGDIVAQT